MSDDADRTEAPTARKLRKAREQGQIAKSADLSAAVIVTGSLACILGFGNWMIEHLKQQMIQLLTFEQRTLSQPEMLPSVVGHHLAQAYSVIWPILLFTLVAALLTSVIMGGGLNFSLTAVQLNLERLNIFSGIKRIFGPQAWVELGKSVLKLALVFSALAISVSQNMDSLLLTGRMDLEAGFWSSGKLISESILAVAMSLVVIALLDVPYQRFIYKKRLRMTKQEVKDEMKDMEGRPEVKAKIRRKQREMAQARMMQRVKDADVIITNPEHFAVALEYDPTGDGAPILVAKGADLMAQRIREEAKNCGIYIFEAPSLARAVYFTTELEKQIPEALFHAVAQVIAYVFSLEAHHPGQMRHPKPKVKLPESMWFNPDGSKMTPEGAVA